MRPGLATTILLLALQAGAPPWAQTAPAPAAGAPVAQAAMTWPEASELLWREKQAGETCARVMKRFLPAGDLAALSQAELAYTQASAPFNAVIEGLQAALDARQETVTLAAVEERLTAGSQARQAFCDQAQAMLPPSTSGEKGGVIGEVLAGSIGELLDAGTAIWERVRDDDALRRAALKTALEDAKWPAFADIKS